MKFSYWLKESVKLVEGDVGKKITKLNIGVD